MNLRLRFFVCLVPVLEEKRDNTLGCVRGVELPQVVLLDGSAEALPGHAVVPREQHAAQERRVELRAAVLAE